MDSDPERPAWPSLMRRVRRRSVHRGGRAVRLAGRWPFAAGISATAAPSPAQGLALSSRLAQCSTILPSTTRNQCVWVVWNWHRVGGNACRGRASSPNSTRGNGLLLDEHLDTPSRSCPPARPALTHRGSNDRSAGQAKVVHHPAGERLALSHAHGGRATSDMHRTGTVRKHAIAMRLATARGELRHRAGVPFPC